MGLILDARDINSIEDYLQGIEKYAPRTIYRGVAKTSYGLVARVGRDRENLDEDEMQRIEKDIIGDFKRMCIPYLSTEYLGREPHNDFEWMALAQHHGVPTRLLDWTSNLLVALFFAVEKHQDENGLVYAINGEFSQIELGTSKSPWELQRMHLYSPRHISQRVRAQSSLFTVQKHPNRRYDMGSKTIYKVNIPAHLKDEFAHRLRSFGIAYNNLFPNLDGIGKELNHKYEVRS